MTDTPTDKHPGGRPTKLTEEFLATARLVIEEGDNALIFTDAELLFQINDKLSDEARISKSTWEKWKAGEVTADPEGEKFLRLVEKALHKQKSSLFASLKTEENQWQRWAWIIERKFDDWNLKRKLGITKLPEDGAAALAAALLGADDAADAAPEGPDSTAAGSDTTPDAQGVPGLV